MFLLSHLFCSLRFYDYYVTNVCILINKCVFCFVFENEISAFEAMRCDNQLWQSFRTAHWTRHPIVFDMKCKNVRLITGRMRRTTHELCLNSNSWNMCLAFKRPFASFFLILSFCQFLRIFIERHKKTHDTSDEFVHSMPNRLFNLFECVLALRVASNDVWTLTNVLTVFRYGFLCCR